MAKVKVLGCGDSLGCPILGCKCKVCVSDNTKNKRTRSSIAFITDNEWFLIDASPDLKRQIENFNTIGFQGALITHSHADHILGIEDLRGIGFSTKQILNIWGSEITLLETMSVFHYRISSMQERKSSNFWDQIKAQKFEYFKPFKVGQTEVLAIPAYHGQTEVTAFRIGDFAYCTDINFIPIESKKYLKNLKILVLGAIWEERIVHKKHQKHFSVEQAIGVASELGVDRLYLTHLSHLIDWNDASCNIPDFCTLFYDGLEINV